MHACWAVPPGRCRVEKGWLALWAWDQRASGQLRAGGCVVNCCYIIEDLSLGPRRAHNPKATRGGTKRVLTRPLSQHRAAEQQASTNKLSNSALVRLTKKLMHVGIQVGNNDCVRNAEIVKEVREPRSNGVVMGAFENEVGFILNYLHVAMEAKAILSRDPRRPAPCDDPKVMSP